MALPRWSVLPSQPSPTISATIKGQSWQLTTETSNGCEGCNATLNVLEGSLLILICNAAFPVTWSINGEHRELRNETVGLNFTLTSSTHHSNWSDSDRYKIVPDPKYTSVLTISVFTKVYAGQYNCEYDRRGVDDQDISKFISRTWLSSSIVIRVRSTPVRTSAESRENGNIIQAGFDRVESYCDIESDCANQHLPVSIIYTVPEPRITSRLLNLTIGKDEDDENEITLLLNHSNSFTRLPKYNVSVELSTLDHNTRRLTVRIPRKTDRDYYIDLAVGSGEESLKKHFSVKTVALVATPTIADSSDGDFWSISKMGFEEIKLWMPVSFSNIHLVISKTGFANDFDEEDRSNPKRGTPCKRFLVAKSKATQACGVLGVSTYETKGNMAVLSIYHVAQRSCIFTVHYEERDAPHQTRLQAINSSAMGQQPTTSWRNKTGADYRSTTLMLLVSSHELGVWVDNIGHASSPEDTAHVVTKAGGILRLTCKVPACHPFLFRLKVPDQYAKEPFETKLMGDAPSIFSDFDRLSLDDLYLKNATSPKAIPYHLLGMGPLDDGRYTVQMKLPDFGPDFSGNYTCSIATLGADHSPKVIEEATVFVDTQWVIPPEYLDCNSNSANVTTFMPGESNLLCCNATGRPAPVIVWAKLDNSSYLGTERKRCPDPGACVYKVPEPGEYVCYGDESAYDDVSLPQFSGPLFRRVFVVNPPLQSAASISNIPVIAVIASFVALFVAIIFVATFYWLKKRRTAASFKYLASLLRSENDYVQYIPDNNTPLNDQVDYMKYDPKFEIERNRFTITGKILGVGEFGRVHEGRLKLSENGDDQSVAIKISKDALNFQSFRSLVDELKIMSNIRNHPNVLALVGAHTQNLEKGELYVITEYCSNGSLKDYLLKNCSKFEGFDVNESGQFLGAPGAIKALLSYAYQATDGMAYLSAQRIIHRDLALRNLLLTANHIVKISDFGMSRRHLVNSVYSKPLSPDVPIPLFWMSVESLSSGQYSNSSDVWSFGIVLWEMFSCGERPYPDHEPDHHFRNWLKKSEQNRMGPPKIACDEMYNLMRDCWKADPNSRPSFNECKRLIATCLENHSPADYQLMKIGLAEAWRSMYSSSMLTPATGASITSEIESGTNDDGASTVREVELNAFGQVSTTESYDDSTDTDGIQMQELLHSSMSYTYANPRSG